MAFPAYFSSVTKRSQRTRPDAFDVLAFTPECERLAARLGYAERGHGLLALGKRGEQVESWIAPAVG